MLLTNFHSIWQVVLATNAQQCGSITIHFTTDVRKHDIIF